MLATVAVETTEPTAAACLEAGKRRREAQTMARSATRTAAEGVAVTKKTNAAGCFEEEPRMRTKDRWVAKEKRKSVVVTAAAEARTAQVRDLTVDRRWPLDCSLSCHSRSAVHWKRAANRWMTQSAETG